MTTDVDRKDWDIYNGFNMSKGQSIMIDIGQGLSLMVGLPTIATWEDATRPKKPKRGTFGFNSTRESLEYFDGVNWMSAQMA